MKGFTLIEILVVVGVLGMIMVATTAIMVNSFRAKARIEVSDVVEQSGSAALSEIKNNLISATGVGMSCVTSGIGTSIALQSVDDGGVTRLVCYEGSKIASESATTGNFDLTPGNIKVIGCDNFAICTMSPASTERVSNVNFSFVLSLGDSAANMEKFVQRIFRSDVVIRN